VISRDRLTGDPLRAPNLFAIYYTDRTKTVNKKFGIIRYDAGCLLKKPDHVFNQHDPVEYAFDA